MRLKRIAGVPIALATECRFGMKPSVIGDQMDAKKLTHVKVIDLLKQVVEQQKKVKGLKSEVERLTELLEQIRSRNSGNGKSAHT